MLKTLLTALMAAVLGGHAAMAADLRIGLQDDLDVLDPDRSRTFVGRIVFTSLCDTLIDIDSKLNFIPRLAQSWEWQDGNMALALSIREGAVFQDGTPIDAEAVKFNIERSLTLEGSLRRSEIAAVKSVEVTGPHSVVLHLSQRDSTLISQLSGWAGMMISPTAAKSGNYADNPVCSGPYKFVQRVQNDRIVLEKFADYWNAKDYHYDRLIFMPVPDTTVRFANLRSGGLDVIERPAPSDFAAMESDPSVQLLTTPGLGYQAVQVNLTHGAGAQNPLAKDARLRQALNLSIDRDVINEVVGAGAFTPATQAFAPASFAYDERFNVARDVEKARQLVTDAGYDRVAFELIYGNNTLSQQVFELVQAMAAEAGFDITLRASEFAALQSALREGNFEVGQGGWAGRVDPDGNITHYVSCKGTLNDGGFCNEKLDAALAAARQTTDFAERKRQYDIVQEVLAEEQPVIFLYYQPWPYGVRKVVDGFVPYPDGIIRLAGVKPAT